MNKKWPTVPLKKILKPVSRPESVDPEKTYHILGAHWYAKGLYTKYVMKGAQIRATKVYRIEKGDFVYNRLFAWKGSFAVAIDENDGCYVSNEFPSFTIDGNILDSKYLWRIFSLASIWDDALGLSTGGTPTSRNRLKEEKLLAMNISLPPLDEQRRIVARIEELAARIEEARELRRRAVEEADALIKASLVSIFEEKRNIGEFVPRPLPQIAEIARGKFSHRPRNEPRFYGGDVPFIQIGDISNSGRYIIHYSQTLNQEGLALSRMFPKGTVVIAITGATIGVTGILAFDSCFPDSIVGINAKEGIVRPEFVYWGLEYAKKSALEEATQTTQPNINLKNLEKLLIPTPSLTQQNQIVTYLDTLQSKLDALKRHQTETAAELEALLPAVLERAFRGEL